MEETNIKKQLRLFKEYGVNNKYTIENGIIVINGYLDLRSLKECDKDFLKDCTINGYLNLSSLKECDKDFLKGCTINGDLYLSSLKKCDKDFLKGCRINGYLYLNSLKECDKETLRCNVKQIEIGYNEERSNCYFDGILSKVIKVSKKKEYTIYETSSKDFVVQKGNFTAHSKTIKKGILDVEFKIVADKIKNEPINEDTIITVKFYRMLTGACDFGCRQFMVRNNLPYKIINEGTKDEETVELQVMDAKDFIMYLEKDINNFGYEKFKSLITF